MCNCHKKKLIKVLRELVSEVRLYRKLSFPIPAPVSLGKTRVISEEEFDMKTYITYEQDLEPLPEAVGVNKDIAKGVMTVMADGAESMKTDCEFDLNTRQPMRPVAWRAPKGSDVVLNLEYIDDDGNPSPIASFPFGLAKDVQGPDAPSGTALGATRSTGEIEVDE